MNLDVIMSNVVEVEVNMMASGKIKPTFNLGDKRPQGDVHPSTSRSSDDKFDMMMKTMEKLMERMSWGTYMFPENRTTHLPQIRTLGEVKSLISDRRNKEIKGIKVTSK